LAIILNTPYYCTLFKGFRTLSSYSSGASEHYHG
jgi:hypothetical protein